MRSSRSWQANPDRATEESRLDLILMYAGSPATAPQCAETCAAGDCAGRMCGRWMHTHGHSMPMRKYQEADEAVQKALAVGIQSARIFDHAGHIAQKLNTPCGRHEILPAFYPIQSFIGIRCRCSSSRKSRGANG